MGTLKGWFINKEKLAKKMARCPGCKKAARINADNMEPKICRTHQSIIYDFVFGKE